MINSFSFSSKSTSFFMKICGIVAVFGCAVCLSMIAFGFVPFAFQNATLYESLENLLEIFNIFKKSFWLCICKALFSLIYFVFVFKCILDIIFMLKEFKNWFSQNGDLRKAIFSEKQCVYNFNKCISRLAVLLIYSYFYEQYSLNAFSTFLLCFLIVINLATNIIHLGYLKKNIFEATVCALGPTLIISATFLFVYNIAKVDITGIFATFKGLFTLDPKVFATKAYVGIWFSELLLPIFHVLTIFSFLKLYKKASEFAIQNDQNYSFVNLGRYYMIRNLVFVCIIISVTLFTGDYENTEDYLNFIIKNIDYIMISITAFLVPYASAVISQDVILEEDFAFEEEKESIEEAST